MFFGKVEGFIGSRYQFITIAGFTKSKEELRALAFVDIALFGVYFFIGLPDFSGGMYV